jgi:hypothetical protein
MLQRSQTPAAIRARAYRARKRAGLTDFKVRTYERLLAKMLQQIAYAEGRPPILQADPPTKAEIEVELNVMLDALLIHWFGPLRKK